MFRVFLVLQQVEILILPVYNEIMNTQIPRQEGLQEQSL